MNLTLTYIDLLAVFLLTTVAVYFVVVTESLAKSMKKRRAIEEFLDYVNTKIRTEEEFNEIVERLRKDIE
jgi:hypothetical protein